MATFHEEGPLKGMATVEVLIDDRSTIWLKHAANTTGYTFDHLAKIAVEETALEYARSQKITDETREIKL